MAERASRRHDGLSSIIMLTTGAVCLAGLALLVTAVLSAQPSTGVIADTRPGLTAEPTTTMEAVKPVAEQIAPVLSGRDDAAGGSPVSEAWAG
ncbi:hypothetical protein, partial [Aeromicrobium sp.]|uniref:hypothetical protein n=1 Tax=Aeromicrobium sp. TaxID=1871063 RepID=UPI0025B9E353